jgi:hypothetical protein
VDWTNEFWCMTEIICLFFVYESHVRYVFGFFSSYVQFCLFCSFSLLRLLLLLLLLFFVKQENTRTVIIQCSPSMSNYIVQISSKKSNALSEGHKIEFSVFVVSNLFDTILHCMIKEINLPQIRCWF